MKKRHRVYDGRRMKTYNGVKKFDYIHIVEKILGYKLPVGSCIHHIDGNNRNNDNTNLVVCQDLSYHNLLHRRYTAYKECGNAHWRKCAYCKKYDDPNNMYITAKVACHRSCANEYNKKLYHKNKG